MNLVTLDAFTESFGVSKDTLYVAINTYKKNNNDKYPSWYVKSDRRQTFIDTDYFVKMKRFDERCWTYATDPDGIYWGILQYINEHRLAHKLSYYSKVYTSHHSWQSFLKKDLWNIRSQETKFKSYKKIDMCAEFVRHGSFILLSLAKKHGIREFE